MENFKNRKTYFVKQVLNGTITSFSKFIDIPFAVDEIRIIQAFITNTTGGSDCYSIEWGGIGPIFMFDYLGNTGYTGISIYTDKKQISGQQLFNLLDGTNTSNNNIAEGSLGFVFEAIQY